MFIERSGRDTALVEIKSTTEIKETHFKYLKEYSSIIKDSEAFCFSNDERSQRIEGIRCFYWREGLLELGLG